MPFQAESLILGSWKHALEVLFTCNNRIKACKLQAKIIIKMYLIENKEVTLFVQLNW